MNFVEIANFGISQVLYVFCHSELYHVALGASKKRYSAIILRYGKSSLYDRSIGRSSLYDRLAYMIGSFQKIKTSEKSSIK